MIKAFLHQPLVWFLAIAMALFVAEFYTATDFGSVEVTAAQKERLAKLWQTQTGTVASSDELDALVETWVREEVLYREALRLGLDQEDSIIRRRLVQKLTFITETDPRENPTLDELRAFYQSNTTNYQLPERYSFEQRYFSSKNAAVQALAMHQQQNSDGIDGINGESNMLNDGYAYRSRLQLNSVFGRGFAEQLPTFMVDKWVGPVVSGYGIHLIKLIAIHPQETTPFDAIIPQISEDYKQQQQQDALDKYVDQLMSNVKIFRSE